ncbi:MAG: ABC transporter permease [Phycisphaerae bacterium]
MSVEMSIWGLLAGYLLLLVPLGILLYKGVELISATLVAVVRMTVQLLFVGLYLQVVFDWNSWLLNAAWVVVMIGVADGTITKRSGLRTRSFLLALFVSLLVGTALPVAFFIGVMLQDWRILDARYVIPIAGMVLGNCLRADIIGLKAFFEDIRRQRRLYEFSLAQGATLSEAIRPFYRDALSAAMSPTVATMATIGLVSLPGMMTGVMLGGADPIHAVRYQIGIMIAIFSGTALTVFIAIRLSATSSFDGRGLLRDDIFR